MNFENLHADIDCNCLDGAIIDTDSHFGRKTNRQDLRVQDFTSYWNRGHRPKENNCENNCSYKGISLNLMNDANRARVIDIFKQLFPISPKNKPYISVIQLGKNSGMIKHSPDNEHDNQFHYDFFKADEFDFTEINLLETISLDPNV